MENIRIYYIKKYIKFKWHVYIYIMVYKSNVIKIKMQSHFINCHTFKDCRSAVHKKMLKFQLYLP